MTAKEKAAIAKEEKAREKLEKERARTELMKEFEYKYAEYPLICGIDEVGRGPLAGPVMTAAVILPKDKEILYLNDSKKLSEKKREELYDEIFEKALAIGIGCQNWDTIDDINILNATYKAMNEALANMRLPKPVQLSADNKLFSLGADNDLTIDMEKGIILRDNAKADTITPDILLVDAVHIPETQIKQVGIIKGDAKSISIAAASIVAKVTRDRLMDEYDKLYPGYGFAKNKGYGTAEHIDALKRLGPTPIHRRSFITKFV
ncbi:MAG: ribonuclease HII [Lachnospiraceae bacterium]|nr:ribonuclease HII [Lachnospiraceae bacterium]